MENERTYPSLGCGESQITAFDTNSISLAQKTVDEAVDSLLHHGVGVLPGVLDEKLASDLSRYVGGIVWNEKSDSGRSSTCNMKLSIREDMSIGQSLRTVALNPTIRQAMIALLGDNPAVVELYARVSKSGLGAGEWKSDVFLEGSASGMGRTFSHIYSLMIPLHDIGGKVVSVCPGSHRCSVASVCDYAGFQIRNESTGLWKQGDGVLFNGGLQRLELPAASQVLVLTFASRPGTGQLPIKSQYHLRWDMHGFLWEDLVDVTPSLFQCIWRSFVPSSSLPGWDWWRMQLEQLANGGDGYTAEDTDRWLFLLSNFLPINLLQWIESQEYTALVHELLVIAERWLCICLASCTAAGCIPLLLANRNRRDINTMGNVFRLVSLEIAALSILWCLYCGLSRSNLGQSILQGRIAPSPFGDQLGVHFSEDYVELLAAPTHDTVLVGSRLDGLATEHRRSLSYHPANRGLGRALEAGAWWYFRYCASGLPLAFRQAVLDTALISAKVHKVLEENDYGDWIDMPPGEANNYIRGMMESLWLQPCEKLRYAGLSPVGVCAPSSNMAASSLCQAKTQLAVQMFSRSRARFSIPSKMKQAGRGIGRSMSTRQLASAPPVLNIGFRNYQVGSTSQSHDDQVGSIQLEEGDLVEALAFKPSFPWSEQYFQSRLWMVCQVLWLSDNGSHVVVLNAFNQEVIVPSTNIREKN